MATDEARAGEYFDGSYRIAASIVRNTVVHETLHALGLNGLKALLANARVQGIR
ncbi:hypothetical protein ACIGW8_07895 [Streptomyces sioyaensis]|uniref:hypothetical protein n=1 Tax=Streptomyces sioyaensis TaxID=67364 RepID=UPI0037D2AFF1